MKKIGFVLVVMMIMALSAMTVAAKPTRGCVIDSDTDMLYYDGVGAGSLSVSWMEHFLDWWHGYDNNIQSQGISGPEIDDCDLTTFNNLDLYIQPGGNAYSQQRSIGSDGKAIINDWINNGGAYFGVCAGWYFASADYYWQGDYYDHANLLGAYPATTEGSIIEIADYEGNPDHALTTLNSGFNAIYYGGPTIGYQDTSYVAGTVLDRFNYQNLPAVVHYDNMLLTSVHLEAYENDGIDYLTTEDRVENYKYLANLINEVAGTNYYVPPYAQPPTPKACEDGLDNDGDMLVDMADPGCSSPTDDDETDPVLTACNDGLDNDGDTLVDMADPGCSSAEDNDETDPTGPVTVFSDGFETGYTWTHSGTGNPWSLKTDYVYDGTYANGVKKTNSGDDSYTTSPIFDTSSYSTATFEYVRKLKGLDAADNFKAQYYNGVWVTVEELGSGRENGNFVSKTFTVPAGISQVRFMCEAGAVSEGCWVDDVVIMAE